MYDWKFNYGKVCIFYIHICILHLNMCSRKISILRTFQTSITVYFNKYNNKQKYCFIIL